MHKDQENRFAHVKVGLETALFAVETQLLFMDPILICTEITSLALTVQETLK